ncbi:MAG: hypothetical protein PF961_07550 [Planctomycetota bacterium]|jgi:hypothetical protein|nr:hypothetical protein [Planctomycetota bacterium]
MVLRLLGLLFVCCSVASAATGLADTLLAVPAEQREGALRQVLTREHRVSWDAGRASLAETIALIQSPHNRVLLQLGADELRPYPRASHTGSWWSAVADISQTYRLDLAAAADPTGSQPDTAIQTLHNGHSTGIPVSGGPVLLTPRARRGTPALHCPNGNALISISHRQLTTLRGLRHTERWLDIGFRVRLAPSIPVALIESADLQWTAGQADGHPLTLELGAREGVLTQTLAELDRSVPSELGQLRIADIPASARTIQLSGELRLLAVTKAVGAIILEPGNHGTLALDGLGYGLELQAETDRSLGQLIVTGLATGEVPRPRISLFDGKGAPLRAVDRDTERSDDHMRWVYHYRSLPPGRYSARLQRRIELGTGIIPIQCDIPLP